MNAEEKERLSALAEEWRNYAEQIRSTSRADEQAGRTVFIQERIMKATTLERCADDLRKALK